MNGGDDAIKSKHSPPSRSNVTVWCSRMKEVKTTSGIQLIVSVIQVKQRSYCVCGFELLWSGLAAVELRECVGTRLEDPDRTQVVRPAFQRESD